MTSLTNIDFSHFWKFKIKAPEDLVSGENPGLKIAAFSLHLHTAEIPSSSPFMYKETHSVIRLLPSWPHLNLITIQKPHIQIPIHWGLVLTYKFWGDTNTQFITLVIYCVTCGCFQVYFLISCCMKILDSGEVGGSYTHLLARPNWKYN